MTYEVLLIAHYQESLAIGYHAGLKGILGSKVLRTRAAKSSVRSVCLVPSGWKEAETEVLKKRSPGTFDERILVPCRSHLLVFSLAIIFSRKLHIVEILFV